MMWATVTVLGAAGTIAFLNYGPAVIIWALTWRSRRSLKVAQKRLAESELDLAIMNANLKARKRR